MAESLLDKPRGHRISRIYPPGGLGRGGLISLFARTPAWEWRS